MSKKKLSKKRPKKSSANYMYSIISITLILFLIGALIVGANFTRDQIAHLKENIEFELELINNTTDGQVVDLKSQLTGEYYVRSYEFVSKEEAVEKHQKELEDDYMSILGENPLYDAFLYKA